MIRKYSQIFVPILSLSLFILLWESMVRLLQVESWILPTPSDTFISLWNSRQLLWQHSIITIIESVTGLVVAIVISGCFAMAMYFSNFLKKSLLPLVIISQTIPFIALAPLLVIWFGFGVLPKIIIVALVCFFPILINVVEAFFHVDETVVNTMKLLGANRIQIFRFAVLPSSLPAFFSGLRIAGSYALLTAVVSEWIGASEGLGVFMTRAAKSYLTNRVFAAIIVVSAISLFNVYIIDQLHKLATPWRVIKS